MGVAYSQTRSFARARIARNDVAAQIADYFAPDTRELVDAPTWYDAREDNVGMAWEMALIEEHDRNFERVHGYPYNPGYEKWLEKQQEREERLLEKQEREECARWEAAQNYPAFGPDE